MNNLQSIVHPVRNLEAAKAVHTALLGTGPHTDEPYYVGFNVGGVEIGLDPRGHEKGLSAPVAYFRVATGTRIATVTDADGNTLGLIQGG